MSWEYVPWHAVTQLGGASAFTPRDAQVVELVGRFRIMTAEQIRSVVFPIQTSKTPLDRTLQRLTGAGYLQGSGVFRTYGGLSGSDAEQDVFRRHATSVNVPPRLFSLGRMNTLASWAEQLARALLQQPLPRRWAHVQGVAARARSLAPVLGADADLLEAAAWLHDIGYAPSLAATGLHALDGARYLRGAQHADTMLCRLVAHHSCAIIEAEERGLADIVSREFEPAPHVAFQRADLLRHDHQPGWRARAGRQTARRDT